MKMALFWKRERFKLKDKGDLNKTYRVQVITIYRIDSIMLNLSNQTILDLQGSEKYLW